MTQPESQVFETSAGPQTLDEIADVLERTWAVHGRVPGPIRMQMGIATAEIGSNIIEHSGQGTPVWIRMEVQVLPNAVQVEFRDDGIPARLDLTAVSLPDDMSERGRGLALAQAVLQSLSYRRSSLNHWLLVSKPFG